MQVKELDLHSSIEEVFIDEDTELLALYIGKNTDALKNSFKFIHSKPGINSYIQIKAVLEDEATIDLEGDLVINTGAKNTNTYLKMDVLMLSPKAKARVVPSLEITEDDVKAGHGATVGELDEQQLFYITSRGVNADDAKIILVEGFVRDIKHKLEKSK